MGVVSRWFVFAVNKKLKLYKAHYIHLKTYIQTFTILYMNRSLTAQFIIIAKNDVCFTVVYKLLFN